MPNFYVNSEIYDLDFICRNLKKCSLNYVFNKALPSQNVKHGCSSATRHIRYNPSLQKKKSNAELSFFVWLTS